MTNFHEDYLNGINFRKELTNKTPREITMVMDNIYQIVRIKREFEDIDEFYKKRKSTFEFGHETWEKGNIEEEYILQEVKVSWGEWTNAKIKLDCLGITAYIKYEHESEKVVWSITWTQFKKLNELFVIKE